MKWQNDPPRHAWPQLLAMTEAAAAASPENKAIWVGLAQSALPLGEADAAVVPLLAAIGRMPGDAALHGMAARLLYQLDRLEEARVHTDAALAVDPLDRTAQLFDFMLSVKASRWDAAAARIDDIRTINRFEPQLLETWWNLARDEADLLELLAQCEAMLAERPSHANAAYFRAFILASLGRDAEARDAMPIERIVETIDLPVPVGYADGESFRAALREEILRNPTLIWNQRTKSIRDGARTRVLRQPGARAVEALIGEIKAAITAYIARHSAASEAFARTVPETARLDIWANILGSDGFLMSHRHLSGWLSGAYYVTAPQQREGGYSGPLLFGALDPKRDKIAPPWEVRQIEPVPGRLVLFPSYAPHATEPTSAEGERISIGFDVIAV